MVHDTNDNFVLLPDELKVLYRRYEILEIWPTLWKVVAELTSKNSRRRCSLRECGDPFLQMNFNKIFHQTFSLTRME